MLATRGKQPERVVITKGLKEYKGSAKDGVISAKESIKRYSESIEKSASM